MLSLNREATEETLQKVKRLAFGTTKIISRVFCEILRNCFILHVFPIFKFGGQCYVFVKFVENK